MMGFFVFFYFVLFCFSENRHHLYLLFRMREGNWLKGQSQLSSLSCSIASLHLRISLQSVSAVKQSGSVNPETFPPGSLQKERKNVDLSSKDREWARFSEGLAPWVWLGFLRTDRQHFMWLELWQREQLRTASDGVREPPAVEMFTPTWSSRLGLPSWIARI